MRPFNYSIDPTIPLSPSMLIKHPMLEGIFLSSESLRPYFVATLENYP